MVCGMSSSNVPKHLLQNGVSASKVGIPANTDLSAIDFLTQRYPAISREVWLQRFLAGTVYNALGQCISPDHGLFNESHLLYFRHVADEPNLPFKAQIIYQDAHLVVADKPHFMPVTPGGQYVQQSLLVQLKQELNLPELSPLHRIDRETAGLVMFSIRAEDRNAYQALFRLRQVEKIYEAIAGAPETSSQHLTFPLTHQSKLVEDSQFFRMRELSTDEFSEASSYNSETWIDCVERIPASETSTQKDSPSRELARYQLKPVTGLRHQLRVHMNALGLPLVGDQFYPLVKRGAQEPDDFNSPLKLLAKKISFKDPLSSAFRSFESPRQLTSPD